MPYTSRESDSPHARAASPSRPTSSSLKSRSRTPRTASSIVRNTFMSVDPYMRGRMSDAKSYAAPFDLGEVMYGGAVGEVVASRAPRLRGGRHRPAPARLARVRDRRASTPARSTRPRVPPSAYLGVLGMPGLTAYVGLLDIAALREGDVVFVSGAAGAVGSLVGPDREAARAHRDRQRRLAREGRVPAGRARLRRRVRLPRRSGPRAAARGGAGRHRRLLRQRRRRPPGGRDRRHARLHGRVAVCGAISTYNATEPPARPAQLRSWPSAGG